MKDGIHPDYPAAQVACACGNKFVTKSTRGDFQVDVCANATGATSASRAEASLRCFIGKSFQFS